MAPGSRRAEQGNQRQEQSQVPISLRKAGGSITVVEMETHRVLDLEVEVLARVTRESRRHGISDVHAFQRCQQRSILPQVGMEDTQRDYSDVSTNTLSEY